MEPAPTLIVLDTTTLLAPEKAESGSESGIGTETARETEKERENTVTRTGIAPAPTHTGTKGRGVASFESDDLNQVSNKVDKDYFLTQVFWLTSIRLKIKSPIKNCLHSSFYFGFLLICYVHN